LENDTLKLVGGETFLDWNMDGKISLLSNEETLATSLNNWGPSTVTQDLYYRVDNANINDFNYGHGWDLQLGN